MAGRSEYFVAIKITADDGQAQEVFKRTTASAGKLGNSFDGIGGDAKKGARLFTDQLGQMDRESLKHARGIQNSFSRYLSPSFFGGLASRGASAFTSGISKLAGGVGNILSGALSVAGGNLITSVVGGVTDKITGVLKQGFDFNRIKEQTLLGFEIKLKGRKEAEDFFNQIVKWSQLSEQELPQVLDTVQRLMSAFDSKESLYAVRAITDRVAGMGKTGGEAKEAIDGIGLALQQMLFKNRVAGQEIMQLAERQVGAVRYLSEEIARTDPMFGKLTEAEQTERVVEMAERNMLDAKTAVAVILRGMEREFGGTSARIAKETLSGIESNTSDRVSQLAGQSLNNVFQTYKVQSQHFLDLLNSQAGERVAKGIDTAAGSVIGAMGAAIQALRSGDLKSLGFEAVSSAAAGAAGAGKSLYDSGVNAASQLENGWRDRLQQRSPSRVLLALGFEAGRSLLIGFQQGAGQGAETLRERLEGMLNDPEIRAFLEAIKRAEGGAPNRIVGGGTFSDFSRHPNRVGLRTSAGPSTAAGSWQITGTTWRSDPIRRIGLPDFSEQSQKLAALQLLINTGAIEQLKGGNIAEAARLAGREWAALPGSPLPGRERSLQSFTRYYQDALSGASGGSLPQPSATVPGWNGLGPGDTWTTSQTEAWIRDNVRGVPNPKATRAGGEQEIREAMRHQRETHDRFVASEVEFIQYVIGQYGQQGAFNALNAQDVARLRGEFAEVKRLRERALRDNEGLGLASRDQGEHTGWLLQPMQKWPQYDKRGNLAGYSTFDEGELPVMENHGAHLKNLLGLMPPLDLAMADFRQSATDTINQVNNAGAAAGDAFSNLGPLIKQSGDEARKQTEEIAKGIAGIFGSALETGARDGWRAGLSALRQDFQSWVIGLGKDWFESEIVKALSGRGGNGNGNGGAGGGGILGTFKNLLGLGGGGGSTPPFNPNVNPNGGGGFSLANPIQSFKSLLGIGTTAATTAGTAAAATGAGASALNLSSVSTFLGSLGGGGGAATGTGAGVGGAVGGGGSSLGSLGAFMTNPWTIGIAAAAVAGFALWRHFRNGTEKKLREAVKGEYAVDVKEMATLRQLKEIGEAQFGRGRVKEHLLETIRLEPAKELIAGYAERTGQQSNKLATDKQYADPSFAANQFVRRIAGGVIPGATRGFDHVPVLGDGGEFMLRSDVTRREGLASLDSLNAGTAAVIPFELLDRLQRSKFAPLRSAARKLLAQSQGDGGQGDTAAPIQIAPRASGQGRSGNGGGVPPAMIAALTSTLATVAEAVQRLDRKVAAMRPSDVVGIARDESPEIFAEGAAEGFTRSGSARAKAQDTLGVRY